MIPAISDPTYSLTPPKKVNSTIVEICKKILEGLALFLYHTFLVVGKMIVVPIFFAIAVPFGAVACITYIFSKLFPNLFMHSAALFFETWTLVKIAANYGLGQRSEWLQKSDDQPNAPYFSLVTPKNGPRSSCSILYAPGYMDEPESLKLTARRLAEKTGQNVYIAKYRHRFFQSIDDHTEDLSRIAQRMFKDSDTKDFHLIGHSMGGLVSGNMLLKGDYKPRKWITIASPFKGATLAYIGLGACARDMRPTSPFIAKFNEGLEKLDEKISLHIHSSYDLIVSNASSVIPGRNNYFCKGPLGHVAVRECEEIEKLIVDTLVSV